MNLFYDEGWKRERETFAASGRGKDKTGFWQRKRGPKMKKKLFYLGYTPAVLSLGILYCFLYRTGVSNQTGFYVGDNFLLLFFIYRDFSFWLGYIYGLFGQPQKVREPVQKEILFCGASAASCAVCAFAARFE